MKYRILGKTGLQVSQLGFGGIPIIPLSFPQADSCIRKALELGINFIDTARAYKDSEEKIGKTLKALGMEREKIILATKAIPKSPESVLQSLEESLKLLQVDYIDLFQLHNVGNQEKLDTSLKIVDALAQARDQGKIRHIGASVHGVEWVNAVIRSGVFETIMLALNFIVREPVDLVLPLAREYQVGVLAMKPMAGGEIADYRLAFKFFLELEDVIPVVGIKTPREIEEVVKIVEQDSLPTEAEIREMDRIRHETGDMFCRRCNYCMPCPHGVDIVTINIFPSVIKRYPWQQMLDSGMGESLKSFEKCRDCGECEQKCPFELSIRQMMRKSFDEYLSLIQQ